MRRVETSNLPISFSVILPGLYERGDDGTLVEIEPPRACPELLTEEEAIRFLRLDPIESVKDPKRTLERYRALKPTGAVPCN